MSRISKHEYTKEFVRNVKHIKIEFRKSISLLTCMTIQNTNKIVSVNKMPKNYIINGFRELISEFKINVIKIGLIPNIQASKEILELLNSKKMKNTPVIIDPIIKSGSGTMLTNNNNLKFLTSWILGFLNQTESS